MSALTATQSSSEVMHRHMKARNTADQAGRVILLGILVITAAVFLAMPVVSAIWMANTPFIGVFIEYPNSINREVSDPFLPTSDIGFATELRNEDEIFEVNGTPVADVNQIYAALRALKAGDRVDMQVRDSNGSTREAFAFLRAFPASTAGSLFVLPYMVGLAYLGIGMWVYRNRRDNPLGRVFLMLCCMIAVALATTFDLWTVHLLTPLWALSIPAAGGLLMTFALLFPNEPGFAAERPWVRYVPGIIGLLLGVYVLTQLGLDKQAVNDAWFIGYYYAGAGMLFFIVALVVRGIVAASPSVREQSRVVAAGTLFSFVPFLISFVFQIVDLQITWVLLFLLFFPLIIAYSIVQFSMLDTGRAVSFTATYFLLGLILVVGYWFVVAGFSFLGAAALGDTAANPVLIALLAFVLVIGFQPMRTLLQARIDNYFFRTRGEYQERLTAFRHDLTIASGLGEVIRLLKGQIYETLKPTHAYVFLRDPGSNTFVAAGEGGRPDTDIRFELSSGLIHKLSTTRDIIFLELNKPLPTELVEEHARLAVLRTPVLATLQGQERLAGFVAVGNKRSGESYATEDLRFVQALGEQASLAVERAQVIGDLERRVRELDVLSQVSQAVNFTTDPDVLMELIYAQTSKLIDATNFYIIMHNAQVKGLSYAFFLEGDERIQQREGDMWPDNEGLASEVVRLGRPIVTQDYTAECAMRGVAPGESRHYAWMGVPLNAGSSTLGVMVVASYTQGVVFTEEQLKVFWAIADQAASALDKARLFREIETRARQLATLNDISKELSSTLELENLLIRIMKSAVEILGAEAGSLFLIDEDSGGSDLVFRVVEGGAQNLVGTRIPAGKGIVGEAVDGKQPVIVNNVLQDRRWFSNVDRETAFQTQSLLAVPLLIQDRSIGVVEVINKKDQTNFTNEDASLLTTFAAQAAVAIDNARLYEATDAELEARVDELQNLQRIDRELNRTLLYDRVIKITLDWALRTTGASGGAIGMISVEKAAVEIVASTGYTTEFMQKYEETGIPLDLGIVGRVLASGKPEFAADVSDDTAFIPSAVNATVSQITVPILRANQPIGVLVLESNIPELLSAQDFEFTQRLVEHAAVAIENARLVQEIESANRAKTEFISFVSHELKNPMTSIRGYTDLLKAGQVGPVTDMQVQFLGTIRTNVDRMTRLVSDLADVARIESGHLKLEPSPISVKDVIDEVLRGMQAQITEKKQELVMEIPEDLPQIFADHTRMVQIMLNLVSNAYKYTPDGGKIILGAAVEDVTDEQTGVTRQMVHHHVGDTGIGLSEEDMEKLFTKFFRTQRGKDMAQGTGLGLNISKNLVERHQGRIWVESEVGQGTTFHFTIPVATEDMQAEQEQQAAD